VDLSELGSNLLQQFLNGIIKSENTDPDLILAVILHLQFQCFSLVGSFLEQQLQVFGIELEEDLLLVGMNHQLNTALANLEFPTRVVDVSMLDDVGVGLLSREKSGR
jgi:hypothetical protein